MFLGKILIEPRLLGGASPDEFVKYYSQLKRLKRLKDLRRARKRL
jgi:hypothetical protein